MFCKYVWRCIIVFEILFYSWFCYYCLLLLLSPIAEIFNWWKLLSSFVYSSFINFEMHWRNFNGPKPLQVWIPLQKDWEVLESHTSLIQSSLAFPCSRPGKFTLHFKTWHVNSSSFSSQRSTTHCFWASLASTPSPSSFLHFWNIRHLKSSVLLAQYFSIFPLTQSFVSSGLQKNQFG